MPGPRSRTSTRTTPGRAGPVTATLYDASGTKRTALIPLAAGELKTFTNFLDAVFSGFTGAGAVNCVLFVLVAVTSAGLASVLAIVSFFHAVTF